MPGFCMNSAGFDVVDDMKAAFAALNGVRAVEGLAIDAVSFRTCDYREGW